MSAFVGTLFKRDVALVENSILPGDYKPYADPVDSSAVNLLTFDSAPSSCVINKIQLQGQEVDEDVFHVTVDAANIGKYIVAATIDGVDVSFELPVGTGAAAVDLEISHDLGKQAVLSLPASESVAVVVGATTYNVSVPAVALAASLFVEFDTIGKPDMTWKGTYALSSANVTLVHKTYPAKTNADASLAVTASATAAEVATFTDVQVDKLTFTGAHDADAKTLTVSQVDVHCSKLCGTDGAGDDWHKKDVTLSIDLGSGNDVVLPVKAATTEGRLAVVLSADAAFAANADVTVGAGTAADPTITLKSLILTLSEHCPEFFVAGSDAAGWVADVKLLKHSANGASVSINLASQEFNFEEVLHFKDASKADVVTVSSGVTFYEQFLEPHFGNILNVSKDAGFVIPVSEDGVVSDKYVRISDLYHLLSQADAENVPDLADRLHALEVAVRYETSDVLESADPEAVRLLAIKDQYSVLDISNL